ncbi:uncharacterized protein A4U43_C05F8790 [Asparagus officinalis]|uniref:MSP domain-containing protein n=1 Tax=Asparagus officinalis TaxID=4686 RepID=A0A5P1EQB0_ASPOF|nr:uncharacterized protein A4U43_C05F8790 [Asparagus officinalis]
MPQRSTWLSPAERSSSPDPHAKSKFTEKADNKPDNVTLQVVCVFPTSIDRSLDLKTTSTSKLIEVKPTKMRFPFELKKQISCSIFISNNTDDHIALKLTSTNWMDYSVRPSMAILLPRSTCKVIGNTVDMVDLKAIYVSPPKPPLPVSERCDKGTLYGASAKATLLKFRNDQRVVAGFFF